MERSGNSVAIYVVTYFMFSKVQGIRDQITIVLCAEKNYFKRYTDPKKSGYYLCECGGTLQLPDICRVSQMRSQDVMATGIEGTWE